MDEAEPSSESIHEVISEVGHQESAVEAEPSADNAPEVDADEIEGVDGSEQPSHVQEVGVVDGSEQASHVQEVGVVDGSEQASHVQEVEVEEPLGQQSVDMEHPSEVVDQMQFTSAQHAPTVFVDDLSETVDEMQFGAAHHAPTVVLASSSGEVDETQLETVRHTPTDIMEDSSDIIEGVEAGDSHDQGAAEEVPETSHMEEMRVDDQPGGNDASEATLREIEQKLAEKEQHCVMLEQQLIQANQQVETCYYQLEENGERLRKYGSEVEALKAENDRLGSEVDKMKADCERLELLETEKRNLSEMTATLTRDMEAKEREAALSLQSATALEERVKALEGDNTSLKGQLQSIESECQAHKLKSSEIYAMYQQLQKENVSMVEQLKQRSISATASVSVDTAAANYKELTGELERATQRCKEQEALLNSKQAAIQKLEQELAALKRERREAAAQAQENESAAASDADVRRMSEEFRMMKMSNAGLVSEVASLKAMLAEKTSRIDNLNCELLALRHPEEAKHKGELDLEDYMSNRRMGFSSNVASRKRRGLPGFMDALRLALGHWFMRLLVGMYILLLHVAVVVILNK
ncbi:hypothetical protein, conserved [Babesia bigemina]|uniref:Uncharacterized protein n=1 Tax=Babesia bigemina TaxID=5866 RepID=A0A061DEG2_BABBI|nr:hypothetical protein, conserved [Babesia bigemina]CDR97225.1 hypothetical protein, conserved [Babesia bigemina]|eukprot:XP_012769411.1 hypothetical protein, conserved [Babesia bigemina]